MWFNSTQNGQMWLNCTWNGQMWFNPTQNGQMIQISILLRMAKCYSILLRIANFDSILLRIWPNVIQFYAEWPHIIQFYPDWLHVTNFYLGLWWGFHSFPYQFSCVQFLRCPPRPRLVEACLSSICPKSSSTSTTGPLILSSLLRHNSNHCKKRWTGLVFRDCYNVTYKVKRT